METAQTLLTQKKEVLADFRPHGFIVLLGCDEATWRHSDIGYRRAIPSRPERLGLLPRAIPYTKWQGQMFLLLRVTNHARVTSSARRPGFP